MFPAPQQLHQNVSSTTTSTPKCFQHYSYCTKTFPAPQFPNKNISSTTATTQKRFQHHSFYTKTFPAPQLLHQNVSCTTACTPKLFQHHNYWTKTFPAPQLPFHHLPTCDLDEVLPGEAGLPQCCSSHPRNCALSENMVDIGVWRHCMCHHRELSLD